MKKAVVDIDGILWKITSHWHKEIIKVNSDCPAPGHNGNWNFYKGYLTEEEMQTTVKKIHMNQHKYNSFEQAYKVTKALQREGYYVTIASHRDPESRNATKQWLYQNNIPYDALYTGFDKHFLLDDAEIFVDDSPISQQVALDKGVDVFSLEYDYNKHVKGVNFSKDFFSLIIDLKIWFRGEDNYGRNGRDGNNFRRNLYRVNG